MTQPTPYTRKANFTQAAETTPLDPISPASLDAEFNAIVQTAARLVANIALIQRDDGALRNGSVTFDTLRPDVLLVLGASGTWVLRGPWVTGTNYAASDVVTNGTQTLAAVSAHVAAAAIEDDITAGKWSLIFDAAGSEPTDDSVTTQKIADGAVTAVKLGITDLTLSGFMKAAAGFAGGTAASGSLFHAKLDAGNVILHAERKTAGQGLVGVKLTGVTSGANWNMELASGATDLTFRHSTAGVVLSINAAGNVDAPGGMRATGSILPSTGAGVFHRFAANIGYSETYDYTASAWRDYHLRGKNVIVSVSGVTIGTFSSTGLAVVGAVSVDGNDLRDVPQRVASGSTALVAADRGKHILLTSAIAAELTIPTNAAVPMPGNPIVTLINSGAGLWTIQPPAGGTLTWAGPGTTGARTLSSKGMATLVKVGTNDWFIAGAGIA